MCIKCGQVAISAGGIGCICNKCVRCLQLSASKNGYCFLCRPCPVCQRSIEMHVDCKMCEKKDNLK